MYSSRFFNYFWIFILGSVFGVLSESIWRLVTRGIFVTRVGVIYGPFNPVYGLALVLMTLVLLRFSKRSIPFIVLAGALLGGGLEYFASYMQQMIFGTVSWDYSKFAFNIHGRTNIPYAILWGLMCAAWIKVFYPPVIASIEKIPPKPGILVTYFLLIFMALNMTVSAAAVYRGAERAQNIPAQNSIEVFLDKNYPDELLKEIYKNMKHPR